MAEKGPAEEFLRSVEIMETLRSENGCPWDIKQDHLSLRRHLLEETYEVVHAIESRDPEHLKEELGDLLLQVIFHAQIGKEANEFDITDVLKGINEKLIRRHPHIYGEVEVDDSDQVTANWESIKAQENKDKGHDSVLDGLPTSMPALMLATKIQSKVARVGFDWDDIDGVLGKLNEELSELRVAMAAPEPDQIHIKEEVGDVLFSIANLTRHISVDAEEAGRAACMKFIRRFRGMEELMDGKDGYPKDLQGWDTLWEEVKSAEGRFRTEDVRE